MSLSKLYSALERMRELSKANVPFSFSYQSYSLKKNQTNGIKYIKRGVLRTGYSKDKSQYSDLLIAYYDLDKKKQGFVWLPLILTFNQYEL